RGRLFLGIGGRDHFGIRGRIASEFALSSRGSGHHGHTTFRDDPVGERWRSRASCHFFPFNHEP
ncbi:hypothetical protein GOB05_33150, partial [Sinorhizobium meliloti]|nr:hypothetical protein [Sinorhizobium meliloti]